ncbi:MAG: hypothetical protein LBK95_15140 [Bifidobacteriaceae bacterium]|jgi:hypothetical protein|nr:hypothetical protein [Bifidobacteriaceae bacterium]
MSAEFPIEAGYPFYGAATGIAIIDSGIPRPPGDVGNARSFDFPVRYQVVPGIGAADMSAPRSARVEDAFVAALEQLAADGVRLAGSSCGLLARYQPEVAKRSPIPVALSSLSQLPLVLQILNPDQQVLVVTLTEGGVGADHLDGAGVASQQRGRVVVGDLAGAAHLRDAISERVDSYDVDRARAEVAAGVGRWLPAGHQIGAMVLECTNLAPFSDTLRATFGIPVWDVLTLLTWLNGAVHAY